MTAPLAFQFTALASIGPKDAFFLGGLLHEVLRGARHTRSSRIDAQEYAIESHCSSLGAGTGRGVMGGIAPRRAHRQRYGDSGADELTPRGAMARREALRTHVQTCRTHQTEH